MVDALARRQGALGGASSSAPSAPIVAVPLTTAQALPMLTPFEKNKGVVAIDSDDDKDSEEGIVFKRRRAAERPSSFRDHPPNASSPRGLLTLEGGGENASEGDQGPTALELPAVLQHALKSFQEKRAVEALFEDMIRERMGLGLGEFLVHSNTLTS